MLFAGFVMLICVHIDIKKREEALREQEERAKHEPSLLHFECPGCRKSAAVSDCEGCSYTCTKCGASVIVDGDGDLLDDEGWVIQTW